jgi:chromosome segregation ATPase
MSAFADQEQLQATLPAIVGHKMLLPHEIFQSGPAQGHEMVHYDPGAEVVEGELVDEIAEQAPRTEVELIARCVHEAKQKRAELERSLKSEFIDFNATEEELEKIGSHLKHLAANQRTQEARVVMLNEEITKEKASQHVLHGRVADLEKEIEPLEVEKQQTIIARDEVKAIIRQHEEHPGTIDITVLMDAYNEINELRMDGDNGGVLRRKIEGLQAEIDSLEAIRTQLSVNEIPESQQKIAELEHIVEVAESKIASYQAETAQLDVHSAILRQLHDDRKVWFESTRKMIEAAKERRKFALTIADGQQMGARE